MKENWEELEKMIFNCNRCKLCQNRMNIVLGEGNKDADIMFVGEGPGADEDIQGRPFVGKAGQLMNNALNGIGIKRDSIYITNIVKCRPPNNRNPEKDETDICINYLRNQVILIKPKVIVLLGNIALKSILGNEYTISNARGNWIEKKGILYMPTWHPAALLRDENKKINFWKDLKIVYEFAKQNRLEI